MSKILSSVCYNNKNNTYFYREFNPKSIGSSSKFNFFKIINIIKYIYKIYNLHFFTLHFLLVILSPVYVNIIFF